MTGLGRSGWWIACCALLLIPGTVFANRIAADEFLVGESFTLAEGETYSGNLIAVDGTLQLQAGSTFQGNIVLFGGSMESAGTIIGQVASLKATLHFAPTSVVRGDVASIGSVPRMDAGAKISGSLKSMEGFSLPFSPSAGESPAGNQPAIGGGGANRGTYILWYEATALLFKVLLLSAVAVLVVLFLPLPAERVSRTIIEQPAVSFLIGMLGMMAAVALLLLLAFTVCLSPLSLLGALVLVAAVLLGWIALGWETGKRLAGLFRANLHPAVQAGIGTMILTLIASGLGYIPCAGSLLDILILSFGLGAVVLTRFGGQDYQTNPKAPVSTIIRS
jgi:hypothetical protein